MMCKLFFSFSLLLLFSSSSPSSSFETSVVPLNQGFAAKVRGTCVFSVSVEFPSHPYPLPSLNKMQILTISLNLVISHVTPELDSGNPPYAFQNVKTLAKCSL